MKRTLIAVALVMLLVAVAAQAQAPAPKPGPEHKKLEIFVGDWTYEGEYHATPYGPAGKCSGKQTVRPILGGFFIEVRSEEKGAAGNIQYYEIDGYDPVAKKYTWSGFDNTGSSYAVTYTFDGSTMIYSGTQIIGAKEYRMRGTATFAPDLMSDVLKTEISADGKTWTPILEAKFTKTKSLPK
jgi:hypothetical protein